MIKVGIIGSTGYAGQELVRILLQHPDAEIVWYGSRSYIDKKYSEVFGNMFQLVDDKCMGENMDELAKKADVIFTATPQGLCGSLVSEEILKNTKIIDLSADFRIKDVAKYEKWYGIQLARLDLSQLLNFSGVPGKVAAHFNARKLVLIAFGDVHRDVNTFFIWRQTDLGRVDVETGITAIQIVTAQGFKVARQFLFLVFTIADHVPPRHFVTQLEMRDQFVGGESMVTNNVNLLDFS